MSADASLVSAPSRFGPAVDALAFAAGATASLALAAHLLRLAAVPLAALPVPELAPVTSVCLLFAAASLWSGRFGPVRGIRGLRIALATLPLAVALLRLLEFALARPLWSHLGLGGGDTMTLHTALALAPLALA
ncbi:MAG TPA: hypothetical protein VM491_20575, partial [Burkholderiaceae bacterium]|nr:hypothetical protein [Burkholderiaceae bacterium]